MVPALPIINTPDGLAGVLDNVLAAPVVALDTEADSFHHYFEKLCLIQIATPDREALVDPLAGLELRPLVELLESKPLVVHGGDYDLRLLNRHFGFVPGELFDTMLAAQLLGQKELSLAALIQRYFGVAMDKRVQRADWSRRPLPADLAAYALGDIRYLLPLAERLEAELNAKGRLAWHRETCQRLAAVRFSPREPDPEREWRLRGSHALSPRALAVLRELWGWREALARDRDVAAFRVIGNEYLVKVAAHAGEGGTGGIPPGVKLPRNVTGPLREGLEAAIARGLNLPPEAWPVLPERERPVQDPALGPRVAHLREARDAAARRLLLDSALLAPKSALVAIATARPSTLEELRVLDVLYRWQVDLLGPDFLQAMAPRPGPPGRRRRRRRRRRHAAAGHPAA
ncbi:MAG: HRDC domain-containing protein [candidate division NC10 bacterium]|nr:HRDC domain-containing protein [candidate division NC10 bacterium]